MINLNIWQFVDSMTLLAQSIDRTFVKTIFSCLNEFF